MAALTYWSKPEYKATVTIQVSAPPPQETPLYSDFGRSALGTEIEQTRNSFSEFLQEGEAVSRTLEQLPDVAMSRTELRENITLELPRDSQLVRISVQAPDPDTAARLANTLVDVGLKLYGEMLARPTANTRQFIQQEINTARTELSTAENELIQFQIFNKVGNLSNAIDSQFTLLRDLRRQADLVRADGDFTKAQAIELAVVNREAELQTMIGLSAQYNELVDQVARARDTHSFLLDRLSEAQIKESQILALGSIQVITPARPPQSPVLLLTPKIMVLGAVASLMAGLLLTFWLEYLEVTGAARRSQRQVDRSDVVALPDSAR